MKTLLGIACLALSCRLIMGQEPKGGVPDKALFPSELGGQWTREIQYMYDPKASPPDLFQIDTNRTQSRRGPPFSDAEMERFNARQLEQRRAFAIKSLASTGADAQIILEYHDLKNGKRFSMHLYRYKTVEGMEAMWKLRGTRPELHSTTIQGEELVYTIAGQKYPSGGTASQPAVEAREGIYHILVAPGEPKADDPGLLLVKEQLKKLRRGTETYAP
jgi:hypothetical protein